MKFEELDIKPEIIKALAEDGITEATKIQKTSIPFTMNGKDVIGISNTGSGKTLSFGIPMLNNLECTGLQAIIMAPTRELVVQIARELKKISKYKKCNIVTVYGGVSIEPQMQKLKSANIVVGTTGRLCDHLNRGTIDLSKIKVVVLDEADKMVDMGFIDDIHLLLAKTPKKKQVLLFGATISDEIKEVQARYMIDPVIVKADPQVKTDFLKQYYYNVEAKEKFSLLVHLLKNEETDRVMIFCSTRMGVEALSRNLTKNGVKNAMIHGKLGQSTRQKIIDDFNKGKPKILIASAVAARGLDIRDVTHVVNYSLSNDAEEYVHRVGRTARAGESGDAITLLEPRDHAVFSQVLKKFGMKVEKLEAGDYPKLKFEMRRSTGRGGYGGRSGGRGFGSSGGRSRGQGSGGRGSSGPRQGRGRSSAGSARKRPSWSN